MRLPVLLLISMYFLPEPGGGSLGAYHRATVLKKIGYRVFILTAFPSYPTGKITDPKYRGKYFFVERLEDFTIIRLRLFPFKHSGYVRRLSLYLNFVSLSIFFCFRILKHTGKIDLVYARSPIIFSCFNGFIFSKISRSGFIYEAPDLWPEELILAGSGFFKLIFPIGKILAKISYSLPDTIITVSNLAKKIIIRDYSPKVPVYSVPTGVDPNRYPRLPKNESRLKLIELNIFEKELQNKFIILYAGIISNAQRVENLFLIAKKVEEDEEIAIVIVGDGDQRSFIENESRKYKNVYLLPYQPRHIMPLIVYSADVCTVLLSNEPIFDIAFPTKFYESIACNKPILGICRGELSEVIKLNNIGVAADATQIEELTNFIYKLKNSQRFFKEVEKNVSLTLEQYTLDNIAATFESVLEELDSDTNKKEPH